LVTDGVESGCEMPCAGEVAKTMSAGTAKKLEKKRVPSQVRGSLATNEKGKIEKMFGMGKEKSQA